MALSSPVLRNVVDCDAQTAAHPAVVQVVSETTDLKRLAAALVLTGVNAGAQQVEDLVVA